MGLDLIPAFTVGVGDLVSAGGHGTPKGPQLTDPGAALRLCEHVIDSGFDVVALTSQGPTSPSQESNLRPAVQKLQEAGVS